MCGQKVITTKTMKQRKCSDISIYLLHDTILLSQHARD